MNNQQADERTYTVKDICDFIGKSRSAVGDYDTYLFGKDKPNIDRHRHLSEDELKKRKEQLRGKQSKRTFSYQEFYMIYLMSTLVDMGIPMREVYKKFKEVGYDTAAMTEYFVKDLYKKKMEIEKAIMMAATQMLVGPALPFSKEDKDKMNKLIDISTEKSWLDIMFEAYKNTKLYNAYDRGMDQWHFHELSVVDKYRVTEDMVKMLTRYTEIEKQLRINSDIDLIEESKAIKDRIWKYYTEYFYCKNCSYLKKIEDYLRDEFVTLNMEKMFKKESYTHDPLMDSLLYIIKEKIVETLKTKLFECLHAMDSLIINNKMQSILEPIFMAENCDESRSKYESLCMVIKSKTNECESVLESKELVALKRNENELDSISNLIITAEKYIMIWYWATDAVFYEIYADAYGGVAKNMYTMRREYVNKYLSENTEAAKDISDTAINMLFLLWDNTTRDDINIIMENEKCIPLTVF